MDDSSVFASKLRNRKRAQQGIKPAHYPHADEHPDDGQMAGDFAGRAQYASANRVADYHCEAEAYAEYLQQATALPTCGW